MAECCDTVCSAIAIAPDAAATTTVPIFRVVIFLFDIQKTSFLLMQFAVEYQALIPEY
jgi:hypothetical protein